MARTLRGKAVQESSKARDHRRRRRSLLVAGGIVLVAALVVVAHLRPFDSEKVSTAYALAPENALPDSLRKAPPNVREAYRFAIANRDILRQIPCYCGCGAQHANNYECYVKEVRPDGTYQFDYMSLG